MDFVEVFGALSCMAITFGFSRVLSLVFFVILLIVIVLFSTLPISTVT